MRVLVITTSYPSTAYPVSGIFIQRMLRRLPRYVRATVLTPACDRPMERADGQEMPVIAVRYAPRRWQILSHGPGGIPAAVRERPWAWALVPIFSVALLLAAIRQARKADLIHAHWSFAGLIGGVAGRLTGVPVVTSLHGSDVRWAGEKRLFRTMTRWCFRLNERIVAVGDDLAVNVRRWILHEQDKVVVISNGVDRPPDRGEMRSASVFTVMVMGNLIALKNVDVVMRAFALLAAEDDRLRLAIVGAGPELARLRALREDLGLGARICFVGQVPPETAAEHLQRSDLLVMASAGEARSSVVLEAMAAGVPVVASNIEGVRELIVDGRRGLLFPVGDAARLAGCMRRIIADPELGLRLADNARQWLDEQQLTWEQCAARHVELYIRVAGQGHSRTAP